MTAKRDSHQAPKFFYGNALVELSHLLPREENYELTLQHIEQSMKRIDHLMTQIDSVQFELDFYLKDIKRMLG